MCNKTVEERNYNSLFHGRFGHAKCIGDKHTNKDMSSAFEGASREVATVSIDLSQAPKFFFATYQTLKERRSVPFVISELTSKKGYWDVVGTMLFELYETVKKVDGKILFVVSDGEQLFNLCHRFLPGFKKITDAICVIRNEIENLRRTEFSQSQVEFIKKFSNTLAKGLTGLNVEKTQLLLIQLASDETCSKEVFFLLMGFLYVIELILAKKQLNDNRRNILRDLHKFIKNSSLINRRLESLCDWIDTIIDASIEHPSFSVDMASVIGLETLLSQHKNKSIGNMIESLSNLNANIFSDLSDSCIEAYKKWKTSHVAYLVEFFIKNENLEMVMRINNF